MRVRLHAPENRTAEGRFSVGVSGNPGGRPKSIAALESEIRELHGPLAIGVLEKLRGLALAGNVPAAKVYLERVLGPARAIREPLPSVPTPPEELSGRLNPLDQDELDTAHLGAVSGIGKWHLRKLSEFEEQMDALPADQAKAAAEHMLCQELGITVEQLQELRASRPA
jgi:hypothetical protein